MKCKFKHAGVCCNCGSEHFMKDCVPCEAAVPMTNADRIRSMTDEEMAGVIMCPHQTDESHCCEGNCFRCSFEWLQQPAKEYDHEM